MSCLLYCQYDALKGHYKVKVKCYIHLDKICFISMVLFIHIFGQWAIIVQLLPFGNGQPLLLSQHTVGNFTSILFGKDNQ